MDPTLNSFKQEIEAMFENTFQQLSRKNNLNKAILNNLMEAASDQSRRIAHLDQNLQHLKNTAVPQISTIKTQINSQEKHIHENFDHMMMRLNQIEEGISQSRTTAEKNLQINQESQQSMNELLRQLQKLEREEGVREYHGNRDQLMKEVEQFEKILDEETDKMRGLQNTVNMAQKTTMEPLKTFETKIAMHNRNNEQILKEKLRGFSEKLKNVEKKIDETAWTMSNETSKAKIEQKRVIEEMGNVQKQMFKLRSELQNADQKRKQDIQSNAATLDNMVEEMLVETKKLQVRVDNLRRGFEQETEKQKRK